MTTLLNPFKQALAENRPQIGLWLGLAGPSEEPAALPATADAPLPGGTDAQIAGSLADDIKRAELLQRPEVLDYQARLTFAGDYQIFIKSAAELSEEERRQRAAALAEEIDRREAAGELALSEALLMQVGLVQAEGGDEAAQKVLEPILTRLCALYLAKEDAPGRPGRARDPVAHFHLSNGARIERLNWRGDVSENGYRQSAGLMVNYLYDPERIEENHEMYVGEGKRAAASALRRLARG